MNKHARELVAALRSGKYKQTKFRLHDDGGYCCLGVACELYIQEHPSARWIEEEDKNGYKMYAVKTRGNDDEEAFLPDPVRKWLGFSTPTGEYGAGHSLAIDNDRGVSFDEIANRIEENEERIFG